MSVYLETVVFVKNIQVFRRAQQIINLKAAGGLVYKYLLIFMQLSLKVTAVKGFFYPITVVFQDARLLRSFQ